MQARMNHCAFCGNLTRDPELRKTDAGDAVTTLRVAINEAYRPKNSDDVKKITTFVDVTLWGRRAEAATEKLRTGACILVEGRLRLKTWEHEGERKQRLYVRGHNVQFLEQRPASEKQEPDPGTLVDASENLNGKDEDGDWTPF